MTQSVQLRNIVLSVVLLMLPTAGVSAHDKPTPLQQTIDYLLDTVSQSGLTFERNGQSYTATEAAAHMRRKYEHFENDITLDFPP